MAKAKTNWLAIIGLVMVGYWALDNDTTEPAKALNQPTSAPAVTSPTSVATKPAERPVAQPPVKRVALSEPQRTRPVQNTQNVQVKPWPAAQIQTRYVDASRLNVRNGPGKQFKTIWTLKRDQKVKVTAVKGDWSYLEGQRFKGWVFSTFLTPNKTVTTKPSAKRNKRPTRTKTLTVAQIKSILIKRSVAYYPGNCPCPYYRDRAGRRCGRRSAYTRPGGYAPLCYKRDVTTQMVAEFRARQ